MNGTQIASEVVLAGWENRVISKECAVSIAAEYQGPHSLNSQILATSHRVTRDMNLHDFADPDEYERDRARLDALAEYILQEQKAMKPRGYTDCECCGAVIIDEYMCHECEKHECTADEPQCDGEDVCPCVACHFGEQA